MAGFRITDTAGIDYGLLSSIVYNCVQEEKLSKLRATLSKRTREQRQKIVNHKINGNTPLFMACQQGKVHFVNYLIEECGADIEIKGVYEVHEDNSRHLVSPLWCAAVANKLDVVQTLVRHGANVNETSDTDSTPVRSACFMTNIQVIKFLVENGADILKPNKNGGTCLINSVQSAQLCTFLISKGAAVNAVDSSKNTALHYAIREGMLESVKVLLSNKADYMIRNDFDDDALQTAATRGNVEIVDVIVEMAGLSLEAKIQAYELLGTCHIDERNDIVSGLKLWRQAMKWRYKNKNQPILKVLPKETKKVYLNAKEPENEEELLELTDPDEIYMQSLLIRERILGQHHKDSVFGLMYRGAVYADSNKFQRCVDLWKYAYIIRYQQNEPLNLDCLFTVQALVKFFWEIQMEHENNGEIEAKIFFDDALEVLQILTGQIISAKECLSNDGECLLYEQASKLNTQAEDKASQTLSEFHLLMQLYLHIIHLLTKLECSRDQTHAYMSCIHRLVSMDLRCTKGLSLLHLAVDSKTSLTADEYYSQFPSLEVVQLLVRCGANVNAQCQCGNTALLKAAHTMYMHSGPPEEEEKKVIEYLLAIGTHVDIMNNVGDTAEKFLKHSVFFSYSPLQYLSLKCLAARVILKEKIPFKSEVPVSLIPFVQCHGMHCN
ncbi:protein fem-1 homolog C-like [Dreissena polymorpha]|uniref:protein fem-1 homolog C-like n=1 Tax=Dreissena polymorpha TaxID=45954 RepID=UPI0022650B96|nr:protein fem-1 homolog C-like [Dreissena polymorpha]